MEGTFIACCIMSALLGMAVNYLVAALRSKRQLARERREKETEESIERLARLFGLLLGGQNNHPHNTVTDNANDDDVNDGTLSNYSARVVGYHSTAAMEQQTKHRHQYPHSVTGDQPAHVGTTGDCNNSATMDTGCSGGWSEMPPMNHARCRFAAVTVNGRLFVFGGQGKDGIIHASVEMFDPIHRRWSIMGPMQFLRRHCAAAPIGRNKVLICGGIGFKADGSNGTCSDSLRSAELYDVETGLSVLLPPMNVDRFGCTAASVNDRVYVFGGLVGNSRTLSTKGEMYHMESNTWYGLPIMNVSSYPMMHWDLTAVATENDNIVVMGYFFAAIFDTETGTWDVLPANARVHTNSNGTVIVGGKMFVLHEHEWRSSDEIEKVDLSIDVFDLTSRTIAPLRPAPTRTGRIEGASIAAIGDKLFVLGGFDPNPVNFMDDGCLSSGEELVIASEWRDDDDRRNKKGGGGGGICLFCKSPNASRYCGTCGDKRYCYCSRVCQRADWSSHKHVCKKKRKKTKKRFKNSDLDISSID